LRGREVVDLLVFDCPLTDYLPRARQADVQDEQRLLSNDYRMRKAAIE
jgi:hypothetical protein